MQACPICSSVFGKIYTFFGAHAYWRCDNCRLVFLERSVSLSPEVSYDLSYLQARGDAVTEGEVFKAKEATAEHYLSILERYSDRGNLLDLGCSTGAFLKCAKKRGWRVYGLDVNEPAVAVARQCLNSEDIRAGCLDDLKFPDNFFSVIVMLDVLEHINEPAGLMRILHKKLKSDGLLFFVTPNVDSMSSKILKNKWPQLFLLHVCLYGPTSMEFLLEKNHFSVIKTGWAKKFMCANMMRRHLLCCPNIIFSKAMAAFFKRISFLNRLIFPFNIGQFYVIAQKKTG